MALALHAAEHDSGPSCTMAEHIDRLPKASKSVLNLRLSTNLDALSPDSGPAVSSACAPAPSAADGVRALYSTASMYGGLDTQRSCTTDALGSKVSLWDLRCEVKTALDTSTGAAEVPVRSDTLQRILDVMREHVHHRKTQRGLKKEAKVSSVVPLPRSSCARPPADAPCCRKRS